MTQVVQIEWLDAIPAAIFLVQNEQIVYANRAAADLMDYPARDLLGSASSALLNNLDTAPDEGWIAPPNSSPIPVTFTVAGVQHDGAPAQLVTAQPRETSREAKRASSEINRQAHWLDEILGATPDTFILFDREGRYLYVNPSGYQDTALSMETVIGKTWRQIGMPEEVGLPFEKHLEHIFATGESVSYEQQFPTLSGLRDFQTILTPVHDENNQVIYIVNTIRDITPHKQAQMELKQLADELEQQARVFDEILSTTPDNFLMLDRESRFVYASPSALRDMQRTSVEVLGKTWGEIGIESDDSSRFQIVMDDVFSSGAPTIVETSLRTPDGMRHFERNFSPLHDKDGQVVGVVVTDHDITDRKYVEEVLRENQRLFTSIFDTALAGIAVLNADGRYIQVNRAFCDIYGYYASELIGRPFSLVFRPADQAQERLMHERLMAGDIYDPRSEWTAIHKDGREIEITAYSNLLVREDGQRFRVVAVIDVTAQKQAQRALEASEQRLTSILNSMEDAVWSVTASGHQLFYASPAIETVTGYSAQDFTANQRLLVDIVHPDDRERFAAQLDHAPDAPRTDTEYRIVRRDGEERWIHNRFWLVSGANGEQRIDGIMIDTTDRRHAAERTMQLAFERERVRILSDFVRDASHEFRTPLSVINTRLYLMEKITDPQRQSEFIEGVREQADRILKLVESLITMSRLDSMTQVQAAHTDLNLVLSDAQEVIEVAARRKEIALTLAPTPDPLPIQADREELLTALSAVFDNAVSFTAPGGRIEVRTLRLNDGEAALDVSDTGIGMSEAERSHIFKRFYRVDEARTNRGFGLGLPIALKIVELHHGRIEVESESGKGSRFRVILPLARG